MQHTYIHKLNPFYIANVLATAQWSSTHTFSKNMFHFGNGEIFKQCVCCILFANAGVVCSLSMCGCGVLAPDTHKRTSFYFKKFNAGVPLLCATDGWYSPSCRVLVFTISVGTHFIMWKVMNKMNYTFIVVLICNVRSSPPPTVVPPLI